jgi:Rv2525c-like, glycoside hydrolase-like domain
MTPSQLRWSRARSRRYWSFRAHVARRWRWPRAALAVVVAAAPALAMQLATVSPASARGSFQLLGEGLDSCTAPSATQMANFWHNTPYWYWGIYIGGNERACSQPNLTASWISTVTSGSANGISMAWKLLPIWVGPQDPCEPGFGSYISLNTSTAFNQGKSEAISAYNVWVGTLGQNSDTPINYDMEFSGGTITSSCLAAIRSFIEGWVVQLHVAPAQKAGVYTSTCGGDISTFATIANPPDFIDGASYDGVRSTSDLPCVSSSFWVNQQRHKQYAGGHNETWNGSTINVDSRCANSWVYGASGAQDTAEGCSG